MSNELKYLAAAFFWENSSEMNIWGCLSRRLGCKCSVNVALFLSSLVSFCLLTTLYNCWADFWIDFNQDLQLYVHCQIGTNWWRMLTINLATLETCFLQTVKNQVSFWHAAVCTGSQQWAFLSVSCNNFHGWISKVGVFCTSRWATWILSPTTGAGVPSSHSLVWQSLNLEQNHSAARISTCCQPASPIAFDICSKALFYWKKNELSIFFSVKAAFIDKISSGIRMYWGICNTLPGS